MSVRESIEAALKKLKIFDLVPSQIVILCEYLMRGVFSGGWSLPDILSWYFDKWPEQIPLYLSLRAAQNHDVFCQPYPAVQIH